LKRPCAGWTDPIPGQGKMRQSAASQMATKSKADWKYFACVLAGWALFLFLAKSLLLSSGLVHKGFASYAIAVVSGIVGGLIGSYVYTAFFRPKNLG
jgi:hypothetical protein